MISTYERNRRQPTLPTLLRLLKAAGFDLRMELVPDNARDEVMPAVPSKGFRPERGRRDRPPGLVRP
jgi:hypothetical protein